MKHSGKIFQTLLICLLSSPIIQNKTALCTGKEPGEPVKIGLLIPDTRSVAARQGAELAILKANEAGGFHERPFELVVRSMEGPWGTGSKQAVSLIFDENVWVLVGSHDGRNAHLVEQASTKAIVPFLSAWAGDPSLSQAFVPWFFNCAANDSRQAETLIYEIYSKRKYARIIIVTDDDYDATRVLNSFMKTAETEHRTEPLLIRYGNFIGRTNELTDQIITSDPECVVLLCNPVVSLSLFRQVRERDMKMPVFSSHYILNEDELSVRELKNYDNSILIATGQWSSSKYNSFRKEYEDLYGKRPGMIASYAFDSMNIIVEAIRNAGASDRELIQKAIEMITREGVTGSISFDSMGNRKDPYYITPVQDGIPLMEE